MTDDAPASTGPADAADDIFAAIGAALDAEDVVWCRLRDRNGGIEDDILVRSDDLGAARRALASCGLSERRHLGHGSHRAVYGYDPVLDRWPKVDLVTSIDFGRWQEWRTTLADACLRGRERTPDGWRLGDDEAYWTLLLHDTLDRPGSPFRRTEQLRHLATGARDDGPGARAVAEILGPRFDARRVIGVVSGGDPTARASLARDLARGMRRARPLEVRRRRVSARILRWIDHLDPPFLRRGVTVALLGPDGAGKSSLSDRLGRGGPLPRRSVYMGLYGGTRGRPQRGRHVPGLGLARRLGAMWRGWLTGWWQAERGRLVVFDRHPYDARLGDGRGRSSSVRRTILGHALPAPDLVVVLDAPAALLQARKPEHPLERVETQRAAYHALAARLPRAVEIDVSPPLDDVARTVTAAAWERVVRGRATR